MALIEARYERGQLQVLMKRATLASIGRDNRVLGEGVRDAAEKIRQRAVRNVSGYPVNYAGGAFVVKVVTGALKGAMETEWPYRDLLAARIFVNGAHTSTTNIGGYPGKPVPVSRYAAAIEHGHGEIDLKKTMMGKTIPFFGARAQGAQGPYSATGLKAVPLGAGVFSSTRLNRKLAAKGKRPMYFNRKRTASGGSYFLSFRKVGKKGWIIPAAKPRPFMAAAAQGSAVDVRRIIGSKVRAVLAER
jgi:hypothetical protein